MIVRHYSYTELLFNHPAQLQLCNVKYELHVAARAGVQEVPLTAVERSGGVVGVYLLGQRAFWEAPADTQLPGGSNKKQKDFA